jgi:hypothetical protein
MTALLSASAALAQVPVGNQATFGRTPAGRSFPFLNGHAYGAQTDAGRPIPTGRPHAYGSLFQAPSNDTTVSTPVVSQFVGSIDVSPTVSLAFKAPGGLIFESSAGHIFNSPFFPFSGVPAAPPVISTVSPGLFQSAPFAR